MSKNELLKILFSLPIVLVVIYFMPFLGVVMLVARKFIVGKTKYPVGIVFITVTTIIIIPKLIENIFSLFKISQLDFIENILASDVYHILLSRCKLLFILGVIALIIEAISRKIRTSAVNSLMSYFNSMQEKDNVFEDNDLAISENIEKPKNTSFVKCPNCGANNVIHGNTGKCSFCKSNLKK